MGFCGCIPRFIKNNASWILTILGGIGVIGTGVLAANEAPAAKEAVWKAAADKTAEEYSDHDITDVHCMIADGNLEPVKLTLWEKFKAAFPYYIPAILCGTATIGCVTGSQLLNMRDQAIILAAYGGLAAQFDQYRQAIRDEYGDKADARAWVASQAEVKRLRSEVERLNAECGPRKYTIATLPGIIFEAKPMDIQEAYMHWNRNLVLGGENDLRQLYEFIGIPESCYDISKAEEYGYNAYENEVDWGVSYVDFIETDIQTENGPIRLIDMFTPPYKLDMDYGPGDSTEMIDPNYNPSKAALYAQQMTEDGVVKIDHFPISPKILDTNRVIQF